jgi:hypothetical protein
VLDREKALHVVLPVERVVRISPAGYQQQGSSAQVVQELQDPQGM